MIDNANHLRGRRTVKNTMTAHYQQRRMVYWSCGTYIITRSGGSHMLHRAVNLTTLL